MPTTLPMLRRSAVEAASNCLYRYQKIWEEGVIDESDYSLRGTAFHACANRYIMLLVSEKVPQDAELAARAFQEGIASVARFPVRLVQEVRQLFDFWSEAFELELDYFLTSEERQERSGRTFTPDLVLGRPDCLEIFDWKTYFVALSEAQAKADFQAKWYTRNAMIEWPGFPAYRFTFAFVRLRKYVSVTFTPDDLAVLDRDIEAVQGLIETAQRSGEWPATPGPACAYCELQCPAVDNDLLLPKRIVGISQAQAIGSFILAGEQQLKAAKKALKTYCSANGSVDIKGVVFDNRPTLSQAYPIDKVIELFHLRGILGAFEDAEAQGLTISHSALKRAFKLYPKLEEELASVAKVKTGYRFSAKKPGGDEDEENDA